MKNEIYGANIIDFIDESFSIPGNSFRGQYRQREKDFYKLCNQDSNINKHYNHYLLYIHYKNDGNNDIINLYYDIKKNLKVLKFINNTKNMIILI